jgi:hypothetical protein
MIIISGSRFVHFGNMADTSLNRYFQLKFRQLPIPRLRTTNMGCSKASLCRPKSLSPDAAQRKGRPQDF